MQKTSKIALGICFLIVAFLVAFYVGAMRESMPEMTENDAHAMLDKLAFAFHQESADKVISFASPDAKVAGHTLEQIHKLLTRAFTQTRNLEVVFENVVYTRHGDTITLDARVSARDTGGGEGVRGETYYNQAVRFTLRRRSVPQLGGLFSTYEWKITEVEAQGLPEDLMQ